MCSDQKVAISVKGVSKQFKLFTKNSDRLKQIMFRHKKYYTPFDAIKDVSFEVKRGETMAIIGRNGSGKSTLLQLICGTLTPTAGEITIHGRVAALLELGAGFNPDFTGRENIYLNAAILGLTKAQITERMDDIIAFADIGQHIDQAVKSYSSGMYVRLAFAVMTHVDADILVIDEALAVGDAVFVQKCMRFLREFQQRGTILFVSHDSSAVTSLCDRALWLNNGVVQEFGEAKTVCESYLSMLFGGANATLSEQLQTEFVGADEWYDQRRDVINHSNLRNDLEVFRFDPSAAGFGTGEARIVDVHLRNTADQPLAWVVGGELVRLQVHIQLLAALDSPIVGFYVKDRLGQTLFGDNSYLYYAEQPVAVADGQLLKATFEFPMPILPPGDYAIAVAIANGSQHQHVQHHWVHDAVLFHSEAPSTATGLVGVPMKAITLEVQEP